MKLQLFRKKLSIANTLEGIFMALALIVLFSPSAKALLVRGLMLVGLFQPDLPVPVKTPGNMSLPTITFQDANGHALNLNNQKGKVIFMSFWATWCPPCIAEMPSINTLHEKLKSNKNVVFMMVDADRDFSLSVPFMKKHQFMLPLYEANGPVPENLFDSSIPTAVIFDKRRQLVFRQKGAGDYSSPTASDYLVNLTL